MSSALCSNLHFFSENPHEANVSQLMAEKVEKKKKFESSSSIDKKIHLCDEDISIFYLLNFSISLRLHSCQLREREREKEEEENLM
jgi:hypothetical protein